MVGRGGCQARFQRGRTSLEPATIYAGHSDSAQYYSFKTPTPLRRRQTIQDIFKEEETERVELAGSARLRARALPESETSRCVHNMGTAAWPCSCQPMHARAA